MEDNTPPIISLIIPSLNQGRYIEKTITSFIFQGYPHKELIIIDGGSTDKTLDVIRKYERHISYWVSEKDQGQAHAINKGLAKAKGDVFNWINSDDYLEEGALQVVADAFQANPEAKVVCGYTHCFFDETGETSHTYRMGLRNTPTETLLHIEMNQPGTFYRTAVVRELGGVNELLRYVMDDELWMRYLLKYGQEHVALLDSLLAHFRLHGSSKTIGEGYEEFLKERRAIYEWIARNAELPEFIVERINREGLQYSPIHSWDIRHLDRQIFEAHFAAQNMYHFYRHFRYEEAKYCFRCCSSTFFSSGILAHFLLFVKLFLIPKFMLNFIRKFDL